VVCDACIIIISAVVCVCCLCLCPSVYTACIKTKKYMGCGSGAVDSSCRVIGGTNTNRRIIDIILEIDISDIQLYVRSAS